jgi:hypothetical protein
LEQAGFVDITTPFLPHFLVEFALAGQRRSGYSPAPHHRIPLTNTDKNGRNEFSRRERLWLAAMGLGLLGLLSLAAILTPSPQGHGTHRQLGLPPCTFLALFGRPCPTCGMTTSWAFLVRGQWIFAFRTKVGGSLLGLLAVVAAPWMLCSAIRGEWLGISPNGRAVAYGSALLLLITLIDWILRLLGG